MKKYLITIALTAILLWLPKITTAQCSPGERMCLVTILCDDMVGDGWNGASLEVWQDTVLRGDVTLASGYSGEVEVPVCTGDTVRFVWHSGPLDYEISFSIANGDGTVVLADVMAGDLSDGSTVAMVMPACPSCVHPMNLTCRPDSSEALVSWTPVNDESGWLLYLNGTPYVSVGSPSYLLTGLTMNTTYTVGVRTLCSRGTSGLDTSDMVVTTFRTTCPPIAIPYFNNFSTETLDALPSCWNPIITFGEAPKVFDEASFSDSLALYFAASGMNVLATPKVPLPGNEIKVTFQAMIEMGITIGTINLFNSSLRAGVMSDLADTSTFIPLVTITDMDNIWREYEFSTSALSPDSSYYVAFFFKGDDILFGNGFVDDLSIMHDNGCDRPEHVYVDSVGSRSAILHWSSAGNNATGYYVYYSNRNNSRTAIEYSWTSDTTILLHGLDQSTTYYTWVRTACGEDSSDYKAFPPFTTPMTCAAVSDVRLDNVGYTAAVLSWQYDALNGYPTEGARVQLVDLESPLTAIYDTFVLGNTIVLTRLQPSHSYRAYIRNTCTLDNGSDTANSTPFDFMTESCSEIVGNENLSSNAFFVSTGLTHSYAQTLYTRDEMPHIDTIWGIAYHTSTGIQEPITFSLYMANTTMTALSATNYVPFASFTPMVTNYTINPSTAEWHIIRFDTPFVYDTLRSLAVAVHNASGHFYLNSAEWYYHPTNGAHTITWNSFSPIMPSSPSTPFSSSAVNYAADVRFIAHCEAGECQAPIASEVVTDSTSVSLAWLPIGTATEYVVQYRPVSATAYTTAGTTTIPYATISGLAPASTYQVRVGSLCDNDTLWDNLMATTGCGRVAVPYSENFDSYANGIMPPCWNYNRYVVGHQYGGLLWQPSLTRQPAVLPLFTLPLNQLEINFRAMIESVQEGEAIVVGVTDDECTAYQWLDTLSNADQSLSHHVWFRYDFSNYVGDGTRIALAHLLNGADAALIDDITVTEALGCAPPTTVVAVSTRDADHVVVQWDNPSGATLWQVAWDTATHPFASLRNWTTTSDTFYSMPPLISGGKYTLYVRALCGSSQSAWRSTTFAAGSITMPYRLRDTIAGCGIVVYDNGGALHNYENNSSDLLIIRPADSSQVVSFHGGVIDLCPWGGDTLSVYEGEGTDGALLYSISSTYGTEEINVNLVSEEGPLTIRFVSDRYSTAGGFELYTSCVDAPACRRPRGVTATATSPNNADIAWTGNASNYDVSYRPTGSNATWRTVNVSDNHTTLSGLTAGDTYELFVRGYCSGDVASPASSTITFTTLCEAYTIAPGFTVEESFEGNNVPARCFTVLQAADNPNAMIHTGERSFAGSSSFRFSSYLTTTDYNQYLISPYLNSVDSLSLRFRYSDMMYGNEQLRVGYSLTGNSPSDFVWTDTLTTSGILWKRYNGSFPAATRFIAINYMSQLRYYAYVDSLQISVVTSADCPMPTITNIAEAAESITVEFTAPGTVEAYITDQNWDDNVNGVTTTMGRHTFVGLQPNTEYTIGLRSHCSNSISSHWATRRVTTSTEGCLPPQAFVLDEVGYTTATFSWEGSATQWEVNVMGQDYDMSYVAETSPFTVTGLANGEDYHTRIRSLCNGMHGEWSETIIDFTTLYCAPVNQLESHIVDVATGTVELSWQGSADHYVLIYGEEHFAADAGTTITDITDRHYRLTGLRSGVAYDYYVKAQCDETTSSQWSERGHFVVSHEGIDDVQDAFAVTLRPNPATGSTTLMLEGVNGRIAVELIDMSGRTVMHKDAECHDGCRVRLDLGTTYPGVYFVRVTFNDRNVVRKVVVK